MSERKSQEIGERAFEFAVRVVRLCQMLDKTAGVPRTLANQLLRSATSVGARSTKWGQT
jgi:four helix bundle protein